MSETCRTILSGNKMGSQELNGIDLRVNALSTNIFIYNHVLSETNLIESLKKALHICPYFSGRIKGLNTSTPLFTTCDTGALFAVESFSESIDYFNAHDQSYKNNICTDKFNEHITEHTPLLQIKLSKYKNGSILGITYAHSLCDGKSLFDFLSNWAKISRGEKAESHTFNREYIRDLGAEYEPQPSESFPIIDKNLVAQISKITSISKKFIFPFQNLKSLISESKISQIHFRPGIKHCIWIAYLWKLIITNQKNPDPISSLIQLYNSRTILGLCPRYFGNSLIYCYTQLEKEKIRNMSVFEISKIIMKIRDTFTKRPNDICQDIAFWEKKKHEKSLHQYTYKIAELLARGNVSFNNLANIPLHELDFGTGAPIWYDKPAHEFTGRHVKAYPSPNRNGDLILFVTLPEDEMTLFSNHFSSVSEY